jgi:hypothetical protein
VLPDSQPKRSRVVRVVQWGEDPARVVCLLGSSRFQSDFMSIARAYSVNGDIVLTPHVYTQGEGYTLNKSVSRWRIWYSSSTPTTSSQRAYIERSSTPNH